MLILKPYPDEKTGDLLDRFKRKTRGIILEARTNVRYMTKRDRLKFKQRLHLELDGRERWSR